MAANWISDIEPSSIEAEPELRRTNSCSGNINFLGSYMVDVWGWRWRRRRSWQQVARWLSSGNRSGGSRERWESGNEGDITRKDGEVQITRNTNRSKKLGKNYEFVCDKNVFVGLGYMFFDGNLSVECEIRNERMNGVKFVVECY